MLRACRLFATGILALALGSEMTGCRERLDSLRGPSLSRNTESAESPVGSLDASGAARLGALANDTAIREQPSRASPVLGYLRAGATVARAAEPVKGEGCLGGWYQVAPRGYVCVGRGATLDLEHPTLQAMSLLPRLDQLLPYPYARVLRSTTLFERDPDTRDGLRDLGPIPLGSTFAVIGSWDALDEDDRLRHVALLINGTFVPREDIGEVPIAPGNGVRLGQGHWELPVAFVTGKAAKLYRDAEGEMLAGDSLEMGQAVRLSGRPKLVGTERYLATVNGAFVRDREVAVAALRNRYPDVATGDRHWIDVDTEQSVLVLYLGQEPQFACAWLTGPEKVSSPSITTIAFKRVTLMQDELPEPEPGRQARDQAWALELETGLVIDAESNDPISSRQVDRGHIGLAPSDAREIWQWTTPQLPVDWQAVAAPMDETARTAVVLR